MEVTQQNISCWFKYIIANSVLKRIHDCAGCWGQRTGQVPDPPGRLWKEGRTQATLFLHAKEKVILVSPLPRCVCVLLPSLNPKTVRLMLYSFLIYTYIYMNLDVKYDPLYNYRSLEWNFAWMWLTKTEWLPPWILPGLYENVVQFTALVEKAVFFLQNLFINTNQYNKQIL
jgi:hypothetical protein